MAKLGDLDRVVEAYHVAADEFSRGNAEPIKAVFSHRDDVTLANPFGPAVRGWKRFQGPWTSRHRGSGMVRSPASKER